MRACTIEPLSESLSNLLITSCALFITLLAEILTFVTSGPSGLTEDPYLVKEREPCPFTGDPDLFTGEPDPFTGDPDLFTVEPDPLTGEPDLYTAEPELFTGEPYLFTAEPELLIGDPDLLIAAEPELLNVQSELFLSGEFIDDLDPMLTFVGELA